MAIVVIGSINVDLVASVTRLPAPGETVPGSNFMTAPGGKGANQALAAARAGSPTRMVGAVGKDAFATEALACLRLGGVDLAGIREAAAATGTALILVDEAGENIIAIVEGANGAVLPGDLPRAKLSKGDVVLLQLEIPLATVAASIEAASAAGALSVLNTAPFRKEAASFLAGADYIVANETEFDLYADELALTGPDRAGRMRFLVERTGRTVIVTLGPDGVVACSPDGMLTVPAPAIEPVDTVGAGDTFCGYFGAGLDAGLSLEEALHRAAAAASLACLRTGAQAAIPTAADVDSALGK